MPVFAHLLARMDINSNLSRNGCGHELPLSKALSLEQSSLA